MQQYIHMLGRAAQLLRRATGGITMSIASELRVAPDTERRIWPWLSI